MLEEWNILLGIEIYFYANPSFCFIMQIWLLVNFEIEREKSDMEQVPAQKPPKHVNKSYATITKDLVGSWQTLLFSSQKREFWINCTELTLFALN